MSGTKTLVNASQRFAIQVTLVGRKGSDPNSGDLPPVTVKIAPGQQTTVQYGNDQNPFLNAVAVQAGDGDSQGQENLRVTQRGGPGTLDNRLNAFSIFKIVADPDQAQFSLDSSN